MARKTLERSGSPLYPDHPESEHQWRLERARKMMANDNLDAMVLGRNVNVFYMSGSRFVFVGLDAPVALAPQSTVTITPDADIYSQRFGPFDTDEVALHTTNNQHLELYDDEFELINILKDHGIGRGARIGIEWGPGLTHGINPLKFLKLKQAAEQDLGVEFVDANPTVWKMTAVKSEYEQGCMRVAVNAASRAMERVYEAIELGMNELEVSRMVSQFMLEEGGEKITHAQVMAEGDAALSLMSCDAVDRPIGRGWVHLDIGAKYRRYGSDINRGIFLGREPTANEQRLYEVRKGINEVMDRTIKPGVSMDSLIQGVTEYVESNGCRLKEIGGVSFLGHAIGLEPYQHPNLVPSSVQPEFQNHRGEVLFEKGMMFTYEMAVELPGASNMPFFNIEDNVVVTETGVENMNADLSRELRVKV
jgi:Xaa-Pro aminopeptidase